MAEKNNFEKVKLYALLHLLLMLFSMTAIFSKKAGIQELFSANFIVLYGVILLILAVYAIMWQQIIKRMSLTAAYANRAVTVVWGIIWGKLVFDEQISWGKVVGSIIIVIGIVLYAMAEEGKATE
jgi:drug/metabolite transporter (DMT)-like permease